MYSDYFNFILNIRNSLIQEGIGYFEASSDDILSYYDLFKLSMLLDDLLYYYRILGISGSEYRLGNFFIPLNEYYVGKIKGISYSEYENGFIPTYESLAGRVEELCPMESPLLDEIDVSNGDQEDDDFLSDGSSIFTDSEESFKLSNHEGYSDSESQLNENREFVEHGVCIDKYFVSDGTVSKDDKEFVEHGVYIDDLVNVSNSSNDEDDEIDESSYEDEDVEESDYNDDEVEESAYDTDEVDESPYEDDDEIDESSYEDDDEIDESSYEDDDEIDESSYEDDDDIEESPYEDDDEIDESSYDENDSGAVSKAHIENDLGTSIQDKTNAILTSIKKGIVSFINN